MTTKYVLSKSDLIKLVEQGAPHYTPGPCVETGGARRKAVRVDVLGYVMRELHKVDGDNLVGIIDVYTEGKTAGNPFNMAKRGNIWGALSARYDELSYLEHPNTLQELVAFVNAHFPETIHLRRFTEDFELNRKNLRNVTHELARENPIVGFYEASGWIY